MKWTIRIAAVVALVRTQGPATSRLASASAARAADAGTLCHVDACLGGWLLPFWEEIGESVPPWTFEVDGVTSISADIHKYGYCFKGASTVMYRDVAMKRRQHFLFDSWPGGLYGSATTAGTRPAPPIAAAWATMQYLGHDGYCDKARLIRDATRGFLDGITAIEGLQITGDPDMSVFEFSSVDGADATGAIGDVMDDRGWNLDRQQVGRGLADPEVDRAGRRGAVESNPGVH